jgi:hypothetical protein
MTTLNALDCQGEALKWARAGWYVIPVDPKDGKQLTDMAYDNEYGVRKLFNRRQCDVGGLFDGLIVVNNTITGLPDTLTTGSHRHYSITPTQTQRLKSSALPKGLYVVETHVINLSKATKIGHVSSLSDADIDRLLTPAQKTMQVVGPFGALAPALLAMGYAVTPCNGKKPFLPRWQEYTAMPGGKDEAALPREKRPLRLSQRDIEQYTACNIGVICGMSELAGVDLDVHDNDPRYEQLREIMRRTLPATPCCKAGAKGDNHFYREGFSLDAGGYPSALKKTQLQLIGGGQIDILCGGAQTILPPSIHPDTGNPYEWRPSAWGSPATPLTDIPRGELPKLTQAHVDDLKAALIEAGLMGSPRTAHPLTAGAGAERDATPLTDDEKRRYAAFIKPKIEQRLAAVRDAQTGGRQDALNGAVLALAPYVGPGVISQEWLYDEMHALCIHNRYITDDGIDAFDRQFEKALTDGWDKLLPDLDAAMVARMGPAPALPLGAGMVATPQTHDQAAHGVAPYPSSASGDVLAALSAWPLPQELGVALRPVAAFNAATMLPDNLRPWVADIAHRMCCAPDFVAVAAIAALGSLIAGKGVVIRPKAHDDWEVTPNIWGAVVAPPAQKKSPAIQAAIKPLELLQAKASEDNATAKDNYDTEIVAFDTARKAIEKEITRLVKANEDTSEMTAKLKEHITSKTIEPKPRKYKVNDATIEKLGDILQDTPAILMLRDELTGLMATWEQSGHEADRGFYLEAWNGDSSYSIERIVRGSVFIKRLCISIFGGIQPDKLQGYLDLASNSLANDGMLQRFQLLVYPDSPVYESRDCKPDVAARNLVNDIFDRMNNIHPSSLGCKTDEYTRRDYIRFSPEAQPLFFEWEAANYEKIQVEDNQLMQQHLSKYAKLFPSLALIFHVVNSIPMGTQKGVSIEAAQMARTWCDYLETHARRCYGLVADGGLRSAQSLAQRLKQGALQDGFTVRDVRRKGWLHLTASEEVQAALDWLEEAGWVRPAQSAPMIVGGRPTTRYEINPGVSSVLAVH